MSEIEDRGVSPKVGVPEHLKAVLTEAGIVVMLDPPSTRKRWTCSRLAVREDGSTIPVLWLLATVKFGLWDPREKEPYWLDRNWRNETVANVGLISLPNRGTHGKATKLGIPSGTPEYFKAYREQNKDKVKQYQAKYRNKQRELLALAKDFEETVIKSPTQSTLDDILAQIKK